MVNATGAFGQVDIAESRVLRLLGARTIPPERRHGSVGGRRMNLPVMTPVQPLLAKATSGLPKGDALVFEPKWDGFRCIVFRDGDEVELGSRNERPLTRYFPELLDPIRAQLPA